MPEYQNIFGDSKVLMEISTVLTMRDLVQPLVFLLSAIPLRLSSIINVYSLRLSFRPERLSAKEAFVISFATSFVPFLNLLFNSLILRIIFQASL
jgi:hypothetical protein